MIFEYLFCCFLRKFVDLTKSMFLLWSSYRAQLGHLSWKVKVRMIFESLVPHELCQVIWSHVTVCQTEHQFRFCFSPLRHCFDMVCSHPSIGIDKVKLVVINIVLKVLSSGAIVTLPLHIAPNFCSRFDPLYVQNHLNSRIPTWNWRQKAFLSCSIIFPKM